MGKRLILHVGQAKTGTSTIQDFLAHNRKQLWREMEVLYPRAGRQGAAHHRTAALFLPADNAAWIRREDSDSLRAQLDAECAEASTDVVVVSSEALFNARSIAAVRDFFVGFDVEVVIILRRQDRWLDSLYQHQLKVGETSLGPMEWLTARQPALNYATRVGRWADVFGDDKVRIGVFEPASLAGGLMAFFFRTAGLAVPEGLQEPPARNERLSRHALAWLTAIPRDSLTRPGRQELRRVLEDWSQHNPDPPELRYFFTPDERRAILARCAESNAALARRFLPDSDGVLFHDMKVEETFAPYPGLPADVAAEIERAVSAVTNV